MERQVKAVIGVLLLIGAFCGSLYLTSVLDGNNNVLDFYVLGDSQGYQGGLKQVVANANEERPDFVFDCGDLTPFGQENQYQDVLDAIAPLEVPFHATPGNHDVRLGGLARYEEHFGAPSYTFDVGDVHFTVLDSSSANINESQFTWLENDLTSTAKEWKVVFTHIPPFDPLSGGTHTYLNSTTCERMMTLFEESGVNEVFTGHIHIFNESTINGVHYVITGGAGASLAASKNYGGIYHYVHATLTPSGFKIEPVLLGQPSIDRNQVVVKGGGESITLSLQDLISLPNLEGASSFQNQYGNWGGFGEYVGVPMSSLVQLVGGINETQNLHVVSSDGFEQYYCHSNIYPNASWYSHQGDMTLAFEYNGTLVPDWADGMRIVMLPEDASYSNEDCLLTSAPGQGGNVYLSGGARWVRYVSLIEVIDQ
jgi:predicted phosphodiesterase